MAVFLCAAPVASAAFGPTTTVAAGTAPRLAIDPGTNAGWLVYVKDTGTTTRIALRDRHADGSLGAVETLLTGNGASRPDAAVDAGGRLTVVWLAEDGVTRTVESAVVVPGDAPFYRTVSATADADQLPQLAVQDAGRATVAYLDGGEVEVAERDDLTGTYSSTTLSTGTGNTSPDVASGNGNATVTVAWLQSGAIRARTRPAGEIAFESAQDVAASQGRNRPQVAVKTTGLSVIAFEQTQGSFDRVMRAYRPAGTGTGWTGFEPISAPGQNGLNARIGVDNSGVDTIVWEEGGATPVNDVIVARTEGGTLAAPQRLVFSGNTGADNPAIAVAPSGDAVVAWARAGRIEGATRKGPGANFSAAAAISDAADTSSLPAAGIGLNSVATVAWETTAPAVEVSSGSGDAADPQHEPDPQPQPQPEPQPEPQNPGPGPDAPILPDPLLIAVPVPEVLKTQRLPDFRPGSKVCGKRFCTMDDVRAELDRLRLRNVKLVERNGDLDDVKKALRDKIDHGDVIGTNPRPRTRIAEPNVAAFPGAELPTIKVLTWDDPKLSRSCTDKDLATELERAPALWPGETTGKGESKRWGAEDYLQKLKCKYRVKYAKRSGVTAPTVERVKPGKPVEVRVAMPPTEELDVFIDEGAYHPKLINRALPGLRGARTMPTTGAHLGGFVVHVLQTRTVPTTPAPGVQVLLTNPKGQAVASGRTDASGTAVLIGYFIGEGSYRIVANRTDDSGLSVDGSKKVKVRDTVSPYETQSGRIFRKVGGKWKLQPATGDGVARVTAAQRQRVESVGGVCERPDEEIAAFLDDIVADNLAEDLRNAKTATDVAAREEATGRFIIRYLAAREWDLLEREPIQDFLRSAKVSVLNLGAGDLKPVTNPCAQVSPEQARRLARGYALDSGPLPVIEAAGQLALPDGTVVKNNWTANFDANTFVVAQPKPVATRLRLSPEDAAVIIAALTGSRGGTPTADLRNAAAGVISTGGGNVISTGGGNVIASDGASLTPEQLRAIFRVIAIGAGNVIASDGASFTTAERAAIQKVISTGGGNVISTGGGNMTAGQLRALMACISTGGANLISDKGLGLKAAEIDAVRAVISTGGGNLISDKGLGIVPGDVQLAAMQGVISTGGGNLDSASLRIVQAVISTGGGNALPPGAADVRDILLPFVQGVISTGGGNLRGALANVAAIISDNGGGLIARNGALIGQAGGNFSN